MAHGLERSLVPNDGVVIVAPPNWSACRIVPGVDAFGGGRFEPIAWCQRSRPHRWHQVNEEGKQPFAPTGVCRRGKWLFVPSGLSIQSTQSHVGG